MCGRFEYFSYDEVVAIAAAVEGRADAPRFEAPSAPRAQVRPGGSVLLFGRNSELDDPDGRSESGKSDGPDERSELGKPAHEEPGALEIGQAIWGFEPEYAKRIVFNTRIESALAGSPMWREPIQNGRCIIPAAAFYEPHATETVRSPKTGRPVKRQYRFALPGDEPLLLAGVQQDGRCSVVTCEPNRWMLPIHDRMPLILRFEEVALVRLGSFGRSLARAA